MPRSSEWTKDEIEKIKILYPSEIDFNEIKKKFPERSANAIRLKASRLGLKRPFISKNVHPAKSLMITREGGDGLKGYIFSCSECSNWIRVQDIEVEEHRAVLCDNCGAICYFD